MPQAQAEPFFLDTPDGARFCLYHPARGNARASLLYLHPFAEEMNKSRRMAALAARRLAASGVAVLQLDLHGCGDSAGEFHEARWEGWRRDVDAGLAWLRARLGIAPGLWGLRLGALLALDHAVHATTPPERLLLWQPVLSGKAFLTQFLRLRVAADLLRAGQDETTGGGTEALRARLQAGETLEVAGYELHPELALSLERVEASALAPPSCPVHWLELVAEQGRPLPPAAARLANTWREGAAVLAQQAVPGPQFWNAQDIEEAPLLLDATCALYVEAADAA